MNYLTKIIQLFKRSDIEKPLGRWRIDYCDKKINNRIDLSNEDHCGPCGNYALSKQPVSKSIALNKPMGNSIIIYKSKNIL